jgi:hypothetical protein
MPIKATHFPLHRYVVGVRAAAVGGGRSPGSAVGLQPNCMCSLLDLQSSSIYYLCFVILALPISKQLADDPADFMMASDAEGKPGPPTDDIQSQVGKGLGEGLSDGNEDADNEPIGIEPTCYK